MNLIERLHADRHGPRRAHGDHDARDASPGSMPAFVVKHYDLLWRVLSRGRTKDAHRATLALADYRPDDDLLDIGCGTGALILVAEELAGGTGLLVGLDVEPGMIAQARAKADRSGSEAVFADGDITSVPYPNGSFDVVTSSLMLHHVPEELHEAGFQELHRVLRPGGRLVIADMNLAQRSSVSRAHGVRRPTEDTMRRDVPGLLEAAGFRVTRSGRHDFKALSYVVAEKPVVDGSADEITADGRPTGDGSHP